jgi:hypothetical protein
MQNTIEHEMNSYLDLVDEARALPAIGASIPFRLLAIAIAYTLSETHRGTRNH